MSLPTKFLDAPIAHRALHDVSDGRPENSRAAIRAAITRGYAIEIDVQMSADTVPMVFHDYDLGRLTERSGPVRQAQAADLQAIRLNGGHEGVPTLAEVLELVDGQVPLVIEIKDQDGQMGPSTGGFEAAVADVLEGYAGAVALMSFNPHSVMACARLMPQRPRGIVTDPFVASDWPTLPDARRKALARIEDFAATGAHFISHNHRDLQAPRVAELRAAGASILCWTVRSPEDEAAARRVAHNITFESYLA